jgi:hypothetical protein
MKNINWSYTATVFFLLLLSLFACPLSTRAGDPVVVMDNTGNWVIEEDLPRQLLLISMEGIVNKHGPMMYLLIDKQHYNYQEIQEILDYYRKSHGISYTKVATVEEALNTLKKYIKGYIVWDPKVRDTINLALTAAGLNDAVIVTAAQIPLMEKYGLKCVEDFRGRFTGISSAEIYSWAYNKYWAQCSRQHVVAIAVSGRQNISSAIGDYAVYTRSFCYDLSTRPDSLADYNLVSKMFSQLEPFSILYGWHSTKDTENDYVTLASKYTHRIEGLESLPNFSFHTQIPITPGFQFKQKYQANPNPKVEKKVYIAAIQSDGLGFGTWLKAGRGQIPFGWEANMNWIDTAPAMLQYYYENATANDYFIGNLGGPGYMYPKPFPKDKLPEAFQRTQRLMSRLDLHTFGIMDYSEGNRFIGNIDLPEKIVDAYYENMPDVLGFLNGYGPAHTFDMRKGKPLISYSHYLAASRSEADAAADLLELARLNPQRPYFMAIHVRESNEVGRVKAIIDRLGSEFQIVPADEMMIMAGKNWNMKSQFLLPFHPDFSGTWVLNSSKSSGSYYENSALKMKLVIEHIGDHWLLRTNPYFPQNVQMTQGTLQLTIGGEAVSGADIWHRKIGFIGVIADSAVTRARWDSDGKTLLFDSQLTVKTAQGYGKLNLQSRYQLSFDGNHITVTEIRSTRKEMNPELLVFDRVF